MAIEKLAEETDSFLTNDMPFCATMCISESKTMLPYPLFFLKKDLDFMHISCAVTVIARSTREP
jgi:hypothetical protein